MKLEDEQMKIKILFFASVRDMVGAKEMEWEAQESATISQLKKDLVARFPKMNVEQTPARKRPIPQENSHRQLPFGCTHSAAEAASSTKEAAPAVEKHPLELPTRTGRSCTTTPA